MWQIWFACAIILCIISLILTYVDKKMTMGLTVYTVSTIVLAVVGFAINAYAGSLYTASIYVVLFALGANLARQIARKKGQ